MKAKGLVPPCCPASSLGLGGQCVSPVCRSQEVAAQGQKVTSPVASQPSGPSSGGGWAPASPRVLRTPRGRNKSPLPGWPSNEPSATQRGPGGFQGLRHVGPCARCSYRDVPRATRASRCPLTRVPASLSTRLGQASRKLMLIQA